ncbi:hypothetical protein JB92DRAFT_3133711 [Gautieria morchelliformis]|nr:hypothetical protein JB92DRAFT_3133711 [Gautieria morchelliformis]
MSSSSCSYSSEQVENLMKALASKGLGPDDIIKSLSNGSGTSPRASAKAGLSSPPDDSTFTDRSFSELIPSLRQSSSSNPHFKPIRVPPPCRFSPMSREARKARKRPQPVSDSQQDTSESVGFNSSDEDDSCYEPPAEDASFIDNDAVFMIGDDTQGVDYNNGDGTVECELEAVPEDVTDDRDHDETFQEDGNHLGADDDGDTDTDEDGDAEADEDSDVGTDEDGDAEADEDGDVGTDEDGDAEADEDGNVSANEDSDEEGVVGASGNAATSDTQAPQRKAKEEVVIDFTLSDLLRRVMQGEVIPKILKPKGTGGRDFNIRKHMGLDPKDEGDKATYKDVMRSVKLWSNKKLDICQSLRHQESQMITLVELKVLEDCPELRHFQDNWPIKALIRQYLKNSSEQYRAATKQRGQRLQNQEEAEVEIAPPTPIVTQTAAKSRARANSTTVSTMSSSAAASSSAATTKSVSRAKSTTAAAKSSTAVAKSVIAAKTTTAGTKSVAPAKASAAKSKLTAKSTVAPKPQAVRGHPAFHFQFRHHIQFRPHFRLRFQFRFHLRLRFRKRFRFWENFHQFCSPRQFHSISDFHSRNSVGNQATRIIGGIKGRSRDRDVQG